MRFGAKSDVSSLISAALEEQNVLVKVNAFFYILELSYLNFLGCSLLYLLLDEDLNFIFADQTVIYDI